MSSPTLEPRDAAAVASCLHDAAQSGRTLRPIGGGTKLSWLDTAQTPDAWLSTRALTAGLAHDAGDLVATLPTGLTLAEANRALAAAGQWLPLDPPFAQRATIGGIASANDSGPRRHRYGSPRDLILGVEMALTDGRVAAAGGRVVKNVAGYDLSRLLCGSFGQLAVLTSITFKLAPLTPASRTVIARFDSASEAVAAAVDLTHSPLTPSAIELAAPEPRLLVRFESTAKAVAHMADAAASMLSRTGAVTRIVDSDQERVVWDAHDTRSLDASEPLVKITCLPTAGKDLARVLEATRDAEWSLCGRAALGVYQLRISPAAAATAVVSLVDRIASAIGPHGRITVLAGPESLRSHVKPAAAFGDATPMMRAVKQQFDPDDVLPAYAAFSGVKTS